MDVGRANGLSQVDGNSHGSSLSQISRYWQKSSAQALKAAM
jgi:hypothetical protein